jgi:hypothetical protein
MEVVRDAKTHQAEVSLQGDRAKRIAVSCWDASHDSKPTDELVEKNENVY